MAVLLALMVTPVTPVMMIMNWRTLTTPVFLYVMMISTVTPHHLTVARIVWKAVVLAVMLTPVTPVILTLTK